MNIIFGFNLLTVVDTLKMVWEFSISIFAESTFLMVKKEPRRSTSDSFQKKFFFRSFAHQEMLIAIGCFNDDGRGICLEGTVFQTKTILNQTNRRLKIENQPNWTVFWVSRKKTARWWFQSLFIFTPICGRFPF